jgi:hypothetical protein
MMPYWRCRVRLWYYAFLAGLAWATAIGQAGEKPGTLPPLHSAPISGPPTPPPHLGEPLRALWLPLPSQPRISSMLPRARPSVRPLPENVPPPWLALESLPERPPLPAGGKAYAPSPSPSQLSFVRWLREQPLADNALASGLESLWADYIRRPVEYWRQQPELIEPPRIPEIESLQREARWQPPSEALPPPFSGLGRPPVPPFPAAPLGK